MLDTVFLAVGIPVILIGVLLPPSLLAGRFFVLWDTIPEEDKIRYGLTDSPPTQPSAFSWIWGMGLLWLLLWSEEWPVVVRHLMQTVAVLICIVSALRRTGLYLSILRAPDAVNPALVSYSRICLAGCFLAIAVAMVMLVSVVWLTL